MTFALIPETSISPAYRWPREFADNLIADQPDLTFTETMRRCIGPQMDVAARPRGSRALDEGNQVRRCHAALAAGTVGGRSTVRLQGDESL
jgi:hypothetical protein